MRRLVALAVVALALLSAVLTSPAANAAAAHAATPIDDRVGALYLPSILGLGPTLGLPHICSASVVHSNGHDLIATAAHCIYGNGTAYEFVPGYAKGSTPDGIWTVTAVYVDPAWRKGDDPHHDIAFLRVAPQRRAGHTVNIEDVTGAFTLGTAPAPGTPVEVTGYKLGSKDLPLHCEGTTSLTNEYPTVACNGFIAGTSGGPWVSGSTLVGVIGGLNEGGCTPEINYSAPFGASTAALLTRAEAGGHSDTALPPPSDGC
jgi:hypothetical protein